MKLNKLAISAGAILSLALLISLIYIGCGGKSSSSGSSANTTAKLTIKGTLTGGTHARLKHLNWLDRFLADLFTPRLYALTAADVAKVIGFNQRGNYFVTTVDSNDNFAIQVDKGYPTALIFIDASDNYLGYLTLSNGIDSLPLAKLADTVTMTELATIDLNILSSTGVIVEPSHNPIGSELPLSSEEQTAIAQGDDFFAAVIKNTDVDNNGTIDLLQNKFYRPFIMYFVTGGDFVGLTPSVVTPANITGFRFNAHIYEQGVSIFPPTVTFTGPGGSGLTGETNDAAPQTQTNQALYGSPYVSAPVIPPAGAYTVTYNAVPLVFNIPAQSAAFSNIVLAVPTVTLNGSNAIEKLDWVYKLGNGDATAIDPRTLIEYIEIQVNGTGTQYDPTYSQGASRLYNSANFPPTTLTHTLPLTSSSGAAWSIPWANVNRISMVYNDIFGNHYVVDWDKP
ncbi:MAG: hypothetical protein HZA49_08895 [Planctomycetes bacterium]|nr:hypothetical protein [Planctomycetota bacterium]